MNWLDKLVSEQGYTVSVEYERRSNIFVATLYSDNYRYWHGAKGRGATVEAAVADLSDALEEGLG